jgi:hypothetical protein
MRLSSWTSPRRDDKEQLLLQVWQVFFSAVQSAREGAWTVTATWSAAAAWTWTMAEWKEAVAWAAVKPRLSQ